MAKDEINLKELAALVAEMIARDIQEDARRLVPMRHATTTVERSLALSHARTHITRLGTQLANLQAAHGREIKRARTLDRSNCKLRERVADLERRARERKPPAFSPQDRIRVSIPPGEVELRIDQIEWREHHGWTIKCSDMREIAGQVPLAL